jgi:hypothetical protein
MLVIAVLLSLSSARANKDTAKTMREGTPGNRPAEYCTDDSDMPDFVVCSDTYYGCTDKKKTQEQYGRKMGACRQR